MIRATLVAIAMVSALFVAAPAVAVTTTGLYNADVPVSGTGASDLKAGYVAGLKEVLVRVSGSRDVLQLEGADELLDNAESLLLSYQVGQSPGQARLEMNFGAVGVNRALAAIGAPVWGANRPLTLAWIAIEDRGQRQLITHSETPDSLSDGAGMWRQLFRAAASERGLPVAFPPDRFEGDRALLSDLWGQFVGRIDNASKGLPNDVMALMRISRSGGQWRAGWVFKGMGMDASERSANAESPEALVVKVVDQWAELYASRYAVSAGNVGDSPKVDVVLDGVTTLADYGNVVKALQGLTPVRAVGPSRIRGERLTVQVTFTGELNQLREYIALDSRFVMQEAKNMAPPARSPVEQTAPAIKPVTGESGVGTVGSSAALAYQPLPEGDEQDAAQAFESLYEVLYYRWQLAPGNGDGD
ncbi:DUF2066 domain-containing protein [Marinobacter sp.]|uniref:DUF2066 domain-containing protein n=1 Tax=Marinobacter sp. TaxID=50741 RepID=UPI0035624B5B